MAATSASGLGGAGLRGRRILVTGASGFLGSNLCRRLADAGAALHGTSRRPRPNPPTWWQPDLADTASVRQLFADVKPEIVYHLAGQVTAAPDRDFVLPLFQSLALSTVNVLLAASESGCRRVVLAASLTEPSAAREAPGSPYAAAKLTASLYGRMFNALYGLSVVITRPFVAYGPGQQPGKVIPYVIRSLLRGEPPKLSSGLLESDWIYIDDVVEGLLRAGQIAGIGGAEIDLGSGERVSLRTVVEKIEALIGAPVRPEFGAQAERPLERSPVADTAAASRILQGWRPVFSLDEGLRRTIAWLRDSAEER